MKLFRHARRPRLAVLCLSLSAVLLVGTVAAAAILRPENVTVSEYDRFRLNAKSATYENPGLTSAVTGPDGFNAFAVISIADLQAGAKPFENYYGVLAANRETSKKQTIFSGTVTGGSVDLLIDGDGFLYAVGGGSTLAYYGTDRPEKLVAEVNVYDPATKVATLYRSFDRYAFSAGSNYRYVSSVLDRETTGTLISYYLSGDGKALAKATFSLTEKRWVSLEETVYACEIRNLVALTVNGEPVTVAETSEGILVNRRSGPAFLRENGHELDFVTLGDVFVADDGSLEIIAYDKTAGKFLCLSPDKTGSAELALPAGAVRAYKTAKGTRVLIHVPESESGAILSVYGAEDDSLTSLYRITDYTTKAEKPIKPASFHISSARSGSAPDETVMAVWHASDYEVAFIEIEESN